MVRQCRVRAKPGAYVFIPPGVPHNTGNASDKPARMLMTVSPPGHEYYFVELSEVVSRGDANVIAERPLRHRSAIGIKEIASDRNCGRKMDGHGATAIGAKRTFNKNRCSRQVSFVRIWKLEVAPDHHRVSGVVNRRRHWPLRAIFPDPPGSAGAIAGQRERVATVTRRAVVDSGCAAFISRGGIHRGQSQELRGDRFVPITSPARCTWANYGFRLSQAALAANSGPAVSIALI